MLSGETQALVCVVLVCTVSCFPPLPSICFALTETGRDRIVSLGKCKRESYWVFGLSVKSRIKCLDDPSECSSPVLESLTFKVTLLGIPASLGKARPLFLRGERCWA